MRIDHDITDLRACRRGDERAARSLYALHAPSLHACARAVLRDEALAHDAVQAVFCRVLTIPARRVRRVEDVRAWLVTLTRREALTALRSRRRAAARESNYAARIASDTAHPPHHNAAHDGADLRRALDALPRRLREVVALRHGAGMSFDQIALALNRPRGTVSTNYRAAIESLRRALGRHDAEPLATCAKEQP